ncbi:DUF1343 domain-containing protein [Flavobacterium sp.]|uniref:exo-beta-N-acetylmuramidase NamZ family protein n=1 Tax=Flavobacterium sp. TaxID=239 RepID=UPI00261AC181|nr:DUF1343 domain-containing protein [Flavobacterium sp.]
MIYDLGYHSGKNSAFDAITKRLFALLLVSVVLVSCKTATPVNYSVPAQTKVKSKIKSTKFMTGTDNMSSYFSLLKNKKVGILTNQTGLVTFDSPLSIIDTVNHSQQETTKTITMHVVDYIVQNTKIDLVKIYAPEHGFRGTADAGELIVDGKDTKTGLPIISLYGNNKKPSAEQLQGIDVLLFDLQDVGARFYTYISSLHYVMEACAENNVELIVLDRPNPNGNIVDGPILEKEYSSFVGMHPIPVMHGMTIGEYALMINGEKWLKDSIQCKVKIVPCENYRREMPYSLPVKPSPNLPNDQAINLYASLCFFEGTNVSIGRGTNKQFQVYGSPYLTANHYSFTPMPNEGAKDPPWNGKICCGEDLSEIQKVNHLELKWLIKAYNETEEQSKFFNSYFTKLAGTKKLQQQIEGGMSEEEIRATWKAGIEKFKEMRRKYLIYPDSFLVANPN